MPLYEQGADSLQTWMVCRFQGEGTRSQCWGKGAGPAFCAGLRIWFLWYRRCSQEEGVPSGGWHGHLHVSDGTLA